MDKIFPMVSTWPWQICPEICWPYFKGSSRLILSLMFNNLYLEEFGKRPNKIAIRGHDITLDLILRVANRRRFVKSIEIGETEYLQNKFNYLPKNKGYINRSIYLIKHEKLNIIKLNDD